MEPANAGFAMAGPSLSQAYVDGLHTIRSEQLLGATGEGPSTAKTQWQVP